MASRRWTRDEVLVAFNLYCRTPFGKLHARNPEIVRLASALNRTPGALAMKCCNLASLDPDLRRRGIKGLQKVSALDRDIWEAFRSDPERIGFESERAMAEIRAASPRAVPNVEWEDIRGLDREASLKVRVNQHLFRSIVLSGYRDECAVCGMPIRALLTASHIVGWADDPANRMNPRNGLCLCTLHHAAFDRGVLLVEPNYRIVIDALAKQFSDNEAVEVYLLRYEGRQIRLPDRWHPDPSLLKRRNTIVLRNN